MDTCHSTSMHSLKDLRLQVPVTKGFEDKFEEEEEDLIWRRRLVSGPRFEKMGVAS